MEESCPFFPSCIHHNLFRISWFLRRGRDEIKGLLILNYIPTVPSFLVQMLPCNVDCSSTALNGPILLLCCFFFKTNLFPPSVNLDFFFSPSILRTPTNRTMACSVISPTLKFPPFLELKAFACCWKVCLSSSDFSTSFCQWWRRPCILCLWSNININLCPWGREMYFKIPTLLLRSSYDALFP